MLVTIKDDYYFNELTRVLENESSDGAGCETCIIREKCIKWWDEKVSNINHKISYRAYLGYIEYFKKLTEEKNQRKVNNG